MLYIYFPSGGLSNQIIQTSFLISLIKKNDHVVLCSDSFFLNNGVYIESRKLSENILTWLKKKEKNLKFKLWISNLNPILSKIRYKLFNNKFFLNTLKIFKITVISDYYQDSKSLYSSKLFINDFLEFFSNKSNLFKIRKSTLALHIRLGDYLKMKKNLPKIYLLNAINKVIENFSIKDINIFTDSPHDVFSIYPELLSLGIGVSVFSTDDELIDLITLSNHKFIIGSASSFTWIASYFGEHNMVIVPEDLWLPIDKNYFIK